MSDELRRLHRKTNPFTNFSDGQSNESPGSTQDGTQDSLDSQPLEDGDEDEVIVNYLSLTMINLSI